MMINTPKKFWNGDKEPEAKNVGELKKILSQLPDNLPLEQTIKVVVYNYNKERYKQSRLPGYY